MSLFLIPLQSIINKILPNLWQRHLEKLLLATYRTHACGAFIFNFKCTLVIYVHYEKKENLHDHNVGRQV